MSRFHPALSAVVAACAACAVQAQTAQGTPPPAATGAASSAAAQDPGAGVSKEGRAFMENAAHAGHAEVEASRMALSRAVDPGVKRFAQQMVDDHTQANAALARIAREKGVSLPSDPSIAQKSKLQLLKVADGADFDKRYAEDFGTDGHRDAVELYDQATTQVKDPDLARYVRETLPLLKEHLQMAQSLRNEMATRAAQAPAERGSGVNASGTSAATRTNAAVVARVEENAERRPPSRQQLIDDLRDAQQEVDEAVKVLRRMKGDPEVAPLLKQARGVFVLPHYGRAAVGVGVQGGEGVMVMRQGQRFSNPAFYNLGGVSFGAQLGGAGGPVAMLLMTDRAVQRFQSGDKFSLTADAGFTIVDYAERAQASTGKVRDVVLWSGTKGAFAGVALGVTDVMIDDDANRAFYGREVKPRQILDGSVRNPRGNPLEKVLPG